MYRQITVARLYVSRYGQALECLNQALAVCNGDTEPMEIQKSKVRLNIASILSQVQSRAMLCRNCLPVIFSSYGIFLRKNRVF